MSRIRDYSQCMHGAAAFPPIAQIHISILHVACIVLCCALAGHAGAHDTGHLHVHHGEPFTSGHGGAIADRDPARKESFWRTPATLRVNRCINDLPPLPDDGLAGHGHHMPGLCGNKPVYNNISITFDSGKIKRAAVTSSGKVRFGPFTLKRTGIGKAANSSDTYSIEVLARSPAVYARDASGDVEYLGANRELRRVGSLDTVITGTDEQTVYVDATLTSAFSAFAIVARVGGKEAMYPPACTSLSVSAQAPSSIDAECLQAAINPVFLVTLNWVPLSIIYEPPGNCSWSNLTESHTAGVALSARHTSSTSSRLVTDAGFYRNVEHGDYTTEYLDGTGRGSALRVGSSSSNGTRLGLPLQNPGNPECNNPNAEVPVHPAQGPGKGEIFILLRGAPMIFWDTNGFLGSALSPVGMPGTSTSVVYASAHSIRTGEGLPDGVTFTDEEKQALLALSPFSIDESGALVVKLDPERFLKIGAPVGLQRGIAREHTLSRQMSVSGTGTLTSTTKSQSEETESDMAVDLAMAGLKYGASAAISGGATAAVEYIKESGGETFHAAADKVNLELPKLFTDESTTTTVVTLSNTRFIEKTKGSEVIQQFFLQDTNSGMNVSIYYDRLFGTYVFVPE